MTVFYQRSQIAWIPLALMSLTAMIVVGVGGVSVVLFLLLLPLSIALLFARFTVTVTDQEVNVRFGGGIGRRIPVDAIRAITTVRPPWYYGIGIHLIPGGLLYNASVGDAIALSLNDGAQVWIGTPEPQRLSDTIRDHAPHAGVSATAPPVSYAPTVPPWVLAIPLITAVLLVVVVSVFGGGKVDVALSPSTLTVRASDGVTIRTSDIVHVSLEQTMPAVRKQRGWDSATKYRGRFNVAGHGDGYVYVERSKGPYVLVQTRDSFVYINFPDPERTRALYDRLKSL